MKRITTELVDDIDGTVIQPGGGGTVAFALDGTSYEIDLADDNQRALRDALAPFIANARSTGRRAGGAPRRRSSGSSDTAAVREWAQRNGYTVGDRGRIPAEIREAYAAAQR
ncbi:MAG: Lsr2 family protein [Microcella sp.]|uniref:histone-like nucleoid-structuring protein Lsr2 n=1 Tax=Microcella sp. TaxID=1913979 RepID=UPI00331598D5